jgi:hypothetical protein
LARLKSTLWKEAFYPLESFRSLDSRLRGKGRGVGRSHDFFIFNSINQQIIKSSNIQAFAGMEEGVAGAIGNANQDVNILKPGMMLN